MSVDFRARVYKKKTRVECVSRELFLSEAAKSRFLPIGPTAYINQDLNILEYFGLLLPVAKLVVAQEFTLSKCVFFRGPKNFLNSANWNWVVWSQNRERWMFPISRENSNSTRKQHHFISGRILFKEDLDYWRAFRSMRLQIRSELLQEYNQNPFDVPLLLLPNANQEIDGNGIIPMYRTSEISKFILLMVFFHRPLPLINSIFACEESQKRVRKRKNFTSIKLQEQLWELTIQGFDESLKEKPWPVPSCRPRVGRNICRIQPPININRYFYRNHYITSYICSLKNQGINISSACAEVADKIAKANPKRNATLSHNTIRKKIYYPLIKEYQHYLKLSP